MTINPSANQPLLTVHGLVTQVATPTGAKAVVNGLSFDLNRGEALCIAGESGSGKSMTALSLMGLLPKPAARVASGEALFKGRDLFRLNDAEMRQVRGNDIGMIFQEPMTSLNPIMSVGHQISEAVAAHRSISMREARAEARRLLDLVQIPDAERRLDQYPHELSGGMRQRVMIAIALSQEPDILIADEPTTALDVTVQAQILSLIRKLQSETGAALIMITHDMAVVAEMADKVLVMREGREVEHAPVRDLFAAPRQTYTKDLLNSVPVLGGMKGAARPKGAIAEPGDAKLLEVDDLTVRFDIKSGLLQRTSKRVHAVETVSFTLRHGETLSLVGESGCGKSTTAKAIMNLVPWRGSIRVAGQQSGLRLRSSMKPILRDVQMVFQDPYASLDPRMRIGELIAEPLVIHGLAKGRELTDRTAYLLERVGLSSAMMSRYPHEFSGGQRQRICIARALSLSPKIIIADECVSALDVSIQAQVLELLQDLQNETGMAYLFISHDMAVVEQISHRVAVMYMGRIVETASRAQLFSNPRHDYTQKLLAAVPVPDPDRPKQAFRSDVGEIASPLKAPDYVPPSLSYSEIEKGHLVANPI